MNSRPYGWDGMLLDVDDPAGWFQTLTRAREQGELVCEEIVPAARTVLLRGLSGTPDLAKYSPAKAELTGPRVEIQVIWDGEDLDELRLRWREDPPSVLKRHTFTVAFCGFAPGFAYLTGLPERYEVPRLHSPRARVPAGSVAVAGPYAGVYPRSTPGGWRLLGHTAQVLFDADRERPALLSPGSTVRFTDA